MTIELPPRKICSTKGGTSSRIVVVAVICLLFFLFAIFVIIGSFRIDSDDREMTALSYFVGIAFIVIPIVTILVIHQQNKSYLEVYETEVTGVTLMGIGREASSFTLHYNEIVSVESTSKTIILRTAYAQYEAMALSNKETAVSAIRQRMAAVKQQEKGRE